ncbi:MAG TPA: hypothetical protein VGO03_20275 [Acidimicrobiia bacterium]|jgi:hypothetical protein
MTATMVRESSKVSRRAHAPVLVALAACAALLAAGCGSSGSKAATSTPASNATTKTTAAKVSSATSNPKGPTTTAATTASLPADICTLLDVSTVSSTLNAPEITATRSMGDEDNEPSCLWGMLGPSTSLQATAFTGSDLATKKIGWKVAFPAVKGAGNGAWSRGVVPLSGSTKNVVLYVDYGNFGIEYALGGPNVTVDQAVTLANKIK